MQPKQRVNVSVKVFFQYTFIFRLTNYSLLLHVNKRKNLGPLVTKEKSHLLTIYNSDLEGNKLKDQCARV